METLNDLFGKFDDAATVNVINLNVLMDCILVIDINMVLILDSN